jgi:hypothetical protein
MNIYTDKNIVKKIIQYIKQHIINIRSFLNWRLGSNSRDTVYFYTFHRCSSHFFSKYVLKNITDLHNIDYAKIIYRGKNIDNIVFEDKGIIYGPIRLSAPPTSKEYTYLVQPLSDLCFIQNKIAIFLIRDPRDIVVSSYYSFAHTHGLSPDNAIRKKQKQHRKKLQLQTIDEYVLESAPIVHSHFVMLENISNACGQSVIIKYEDMIDNWEYFISGFTKFINIKQTILAEIYKQSRPLENEDNKSHRRSGKPNAFKDKLKIETVNSLNVTFKDTLEKYNYI